MYESENEEIIRNNTYFIDDGPYLFSKLDVKTVKKNIISINFISHNRKLELKFLKGKVYEFKTSKYIVDEDRQKINKKDLKMLEENGTMIKLIF